MKFKFTVPKTPIYDVKKAEKVVSTEIHKSLNSMLGAVKRRAQKTAPVGATGNLRGTITDTIITKGAKIIGEVGAQAKYAPFVEYGTAPAKRKGDTKAFLKSLEDWITSSTGGHKFMAWYKSKHPKGTIEGAAKTLKFFINRKGKKATFFFKRAVDSSADFIRKVGNEILPNIMRALK
jgi:hypothetical protein